MPPPETVAGRLKAQRFHSGRRTEQAKAKLDPRVGSQVAPRVDHESPHECWFSLFSGLVKDSPGKLPQNVPQRCPRKCPRKVSTQVVGAHLSYFHLFCSSTTVRDLGSFQSFVQLCVCEEQHVNTGHASLEWMSEIFIQSFRGQHRGGRNFTSSLRFSRPFFYAAKRALSTLKLAPPWREPPETPLEILEQRSWNCCWRHLVSDWASRRWSSMYFARKHWDC